MRVGLTGGIGSGKSEVARILEDLGAYIIDTDVLAREAVAPHSDGIMAIARVWPHVVRAGMLDRQALGEIVFRDPLARERLNSIVHPFIRRLAQEREAHAKPGQVVVHVVPLLFETGYGELTDKSIVVIAPEVERIARVVQRDRINEGQVRARMAAQIDPKEAAVRADFVIENDGNLAHLRERTRSVYALLV
ncbi:MAG TPA: dephospho-CoA kinase [Candidatus Baltobacteraceae bacterium]|jgi:dephospho-CoA kinase|nr:dephospho-CoA kinase [Candidatus Baltobacteraceae bacterium]